jgi:transposase
MRVAPPVDLTPAERKALIRWSRRRGTPARLVLRTAIVLRAAEGHRNQDIAAALGTNRHTVALWRKRFRDKGIAGIEKDAPRGGRKPTVRSRVERLIVEKSTQEKPCSATHWSERTLAKELGVSRSMVQRVWKAHGLKPTESRRSSSVEIPTT